MEFFFFFLFLFLFLMTSFFRLVLQDDRILGWSRSFLLVRIEESQLVRLRDLRDSIFRPGQPCISQVVESGRGLGDRVE